MTKEEAVRNQIKFYKTGIHTYLVQYYKNNQYQFFLEECDKQKCELDMVRHACDTLKKMTFDIRRNKFQVVEGGKL